MYTCCVPYLCLHTTICIFIPIRLLRVVYATHSKNTQIKMKLLFPFPVTYKFTIYTYLQRPTAVECHHANLLPSVADQSVIYNTGRMSTVRLREHCRQKPAVKPSAPLYCISSSNSTVYTRIPFLLDWFYGLSDNLMFLLCSTAGFVCMVN